MPFRYLRDPLFLACVGVYLVNRLVLKRVWETGFVHEHLNDLICLPFWVPVMLWAERRVGLRRHDGPPDVVEIVVPLVLWAWAFEVILPATGWFGPFCVADERDVFWYAVGATGAGAFWRWWYRGRERGRVDTGEVPALPAGGPYSNRINRSPPSTCEPAGASTSATLPAAGA